MFLWLRFLRWTMKTPIIAEAHCDAPCGVYDPASARIAAEAVQSMTKKMLAMTCPDTNDSAAMAAYMNTMARYAAVKEEEAQNCKDELLILWTDFFKPQHLESIPDLHDTFWRHPPASRYSKRTIEWPSVSSVHQALNTPGRRQVWACSLVR